jgi:hypothetical protein
MRVDTTFLYPSVFRLCQLVSQWRVAVTECSAMAVVFWCGVGVGVGVGIGVGVGVGMGLELELVQNSNEGYI